MELHITAVPILFFTVLTSVDSFAFLPQQQSRPSCRLAAENKLSTIEDQDLVAKPIAFLDPDGSENAIMCHVDAIATIDDVDYSVGYPCDHAVDVSPVTNVWFLLPCTFLLLKSSH